VTKRVKIAALIGNGGRLNAIWEGTQEADSLAELAAVITFKKNSPGALWARTQNIPTYTVRWPEFRDAGKQRADYDLYIAELLKGCGVELVAIAGWGLMLTREFLSEFPNRIINVHPALLSDTLEASIRTHSGVSIPVFRGNHALELALAAGVETTGCTVHYVTEEMDCGPVILRREVAIRGNDALETLSDRVHLAEDAILPQAINIACARILGAKNQSSALD